MTEQFCSYETSLLLKQCGFHETVRHYYAEGQPEPTPFKFDNGWEGYDDWNSQKDMTTKAGLVVASAPTQALAMRWLREEKGILLAFLPWFNGEDHEIEYLGYDAQWVLIASLIGQQPTYEQAVEAGLKAACDYIIKQKEEQ